MIWHRNFSPEWGTCPSAATFRRGFCRLLDSLLGAALGASFIYGAGAIYLRWRGAEGMGFGDVKLMAMVGAFLGMKLTDLYDFYRVAGGIVVWVDYGIRRLAEAHPPLYEAAGQCASRPAARLAIGTGGLPQLPDAVWRLSRAAWRWSRFSLATDSCTGTGGSGEESWQIPCCCGRWWCWSAPGFAFLFGLLFMRLLRKNIAEEGDLSANARPRWRLCRCTCTTR